MTTTPMRPTVKLTFLALTIIIRLLRHLVINLDGSQTSKELDQQSSDMVRKLMNEVNKG